MRELILSQTDIDNLARGNAVKVCAFMGEDIVVMPQTQFRAVITIDIPANSARDANDVICGVKELLDPIDREHTIGANILARNSDGTWREVV